jgi:hypothetical protein
MYKIVHYLTLSSTSEGGPPRKVSTSVIIHLQNFHSSTSFLQNLLLQYVLLLFRNRISNIRKFCLGRKVRTGSLLHTFSRLLVEV